MIFSILLLVISLNIDSLGAGLVYGMQRKYIPRIYQYAICILSIIYSGASLLVGHFMSNNLSYNFGKYLGICILFCMGIYSLFRAFDTKNNSSTTKLSESNNATLSESLILGFALSLDSIGAGISFCLLGCGIMLLPFAIGLGQLLFLNWGLLIGNKINNKDQPKLINSKIMSSIPGIILIILALLRLK